MFIVIWSNEQIYIHYQQHIHPNRQVDNPWSWGPADGTFLVSLSEEHALAMIGKYDLEMEICKESA